MDSDIRRLFRQASQPSLVTQPSPAVDASPPHVGQSALNSSTSDSRGSSGKSRRVNNWPPPSRSAFRRVHRRSITSSDFPRNNPTSTTGITHSIPSMSYTPTVPEHDLLEVLHSAQLHLRRALLSPRSPSSVTPVLRYVSALVTRLNLTSVAPNAESALALPLATLYQTVHQLLQTQALNRTVTSQLGLWRQSHQQSLANDSQRLRELHGLFLFMLGLGRWYARADLTTAGVSELVQRVDLTPQGRWTADVLEAVLRNRVIATRGGVLIDRGAINQSDQLCLGSIWQEVRGICTAEISRVLKWWRWARLERAGMEVLNGGGEVRECMKRAVERVVLERKEKRNNVETTTGVSVKFGRRAQL